VSAAPDWLELCRRAAAGAAAAIEEGDRTTTTGRGAGGDEALAIDRAAEDAVFAVLDEVDGGMTAISEERGELELAGGGPLRVVIDPIDGSRNAGRNLPHYCLSLAVADGPSMADVSFAYVHDFSRGEDWWAARGEGAFCDGEELRAELRADGQLELLGVETTSPEAVREGAEALADLGAQRLRAFGSVALTLCCVAAGRLDAMLTLEPTRSVDAAAGQLLVREAGGSVAFPDAGGRDPLGAPLDLDMRSRVLAATHDGGLARLLASVG